MFAKYLVKNNPLPKHAEDFSSIFGVLADVCVTLLINPYLGLHIAYSSVSNKSHSLLSWNFSTDGYQYSVSTDGYWCIYQPSQMPVCFRTFENDYSLYFFHPHVHTYCAIYTCVF